MTIPILDPAVVEVNGVLDKVEHMGVRKGDIFLLRFNTLMPELSADLINKYAQLLHRASKGRVSIVPLPTGLKVEKVEAAVKESIKQEIMVEIAQEIEAAGVKENMTPEQVMEAIKKEDTTDACT